MYILYMLCMYIHILCIYIYNVRIKYIKVTLNFHSSAFLNMNNYKGKPFLFLFIHFSRFPFFKRTEKCRLFFHIEFCIAGRLGGSVG